MAPPATFIAVQCCQCSTMQVKQQKKSSNKWTCVVCNQKQSLRKVFAQGFMAKDVRKFVQSFNMTRQFADQNQSQLNSNQIKELEGIGDRFATNLQQRRNNWTEYLDPPEEEETNFGENSENDEFDLKVVTEMPEPVFKKPKFSNYTVSPTGGKHHARTFNKQNSKGESSRRAAESSSSKCCAAMVKENSRQLHYAPEIRTEDISANRTDVEDTITKWKGGLIREDSEKFANQAPWGGKSAKTGVSSKWSSYISADNEDLPLANGTDLTVQAREWKEDAFETESINQRVEEDIHPDFL